MRASCVRGFVSALLTMSAVAACSSPTVPPAFTSPGLTSFKSVTLSPRPASAQPTGNADAPWHVEFTVTVRETRGVGIEVYAVTVGSFNEHTFDTDDILAAAGVNRIGPRESLDIPVGALLSHREWWSRDLNLCRRALHRRERLQHYGINELDGPRRIGPVRGAPLRGRGKHSIVSPATAVSRRGPSRHLRMGSGRHAGRTPAPWRGCGRRCRLGCPRTDSTAGRD